MSQLAGLSAENPFAQQLALRDFSSRLRGHSNEAGRGENSHGRLRLQLRSSDSFVQSAQPAAEPATALAPSQLYASSSSAKLNLSSQTLVHQNEETGATRVVQRDSLDFRFSSSQISVGNGDPAAIGDLLEGQADILQKLFDAVGLLGDFSSGLADEFLGRVQEGLEGSGDATQFQASSLDLKIRIQSRSITVEDGEGGTRVEKSVLKISVKVRFVSLTTQGEVAEPQEPVEAGIADQQAQLQGQGPLAQFDINGDGKFSFEDVAALADEVFEVGDGA
jgi:hypothetical protein